jgi:non-ribosomal peptide synthetase component F
VNDGEEIVLTALPLYHIFAFTCNLLFFVKTGGRNVLVPSPRPPSNLKAAWEKYPITWFSGVNTLFNALANEDWFVASPPKHLKFSVAGGMALHGSVARHWRQVTGTDVVEGYGLTETSPVTHFNPFGQVREGTIGIPLPSTDVLLLDEEGKPVPTGIAGEITIRGPQVMLGYWQRPEESAKVLQDGWLRTGDVGVIDEDGYFKIVDRKKDMILVSGFNVYQRGGGGHLPPSQGARGRRDRRSGREERRDREGVCGQGRPEPQRGGGAGPLPRVPRRVQDPALGRLPRRPAQEPHRQDPAQGSARAHGRAGSARELAHR